MSKPVNAANARIKRVYFAFLVEAKRNRAQTVDIAAAALSRFETYTKGRDFKTFRQEQAIGFKRQLGEQRSARTTTGLSKATMYSTLAALKAFFKWLSMQPGYKSRLTYSDAEFFNMQAGDIAIAKAAGERRAPTLEQVRHVIAAMPVGTDIEKRDRAIVAFTILTGARDNAVASMCLKHVDLVEGLVRQNPREGVRTKFSKTLTTTFFPVGEDIRGIVVDWVRFLLQDRCFGHDEPLFPATKVARGASGGFQAIGLDRVGWTTAGPIRKVFRSAFDAAGLPYYNPHSFRKTLARLGQERCATPEELKAWSQNLGHDSVLTTFTSYGSLDSKRQAEILRALASPRPANSENAQLASEMRRMADRLAPTPR